MFRREWGLAVAVVARLTGDLGLAEDAVQEAFAVAVDRWASGPLPSDPSGWLITVARNHALDRLRREARRSGKEQAAMLMLSQHDPPEAAGKIADDRLRLIFACCHPALDPGTRVALTLRTLCGLCPGDPEALGLLALLLLTDARRGARATADGRLVLLEDQDRGRWDHAKIDEGTQVLDRAIRLRRSGPYQLQAAIAACHAAAEKAGDTDWAEIAALYQALARFEPSPWCTPTGRSRWRCPRGQPPDWPSSTTSAATARASAGTCCMPAGPTCCAGWDAPPSRPRLPDRARPRPAARRARVPRRASRGN